MSHLYELHRFVLYEIPWLESKRFLDLGCGKGVWGYLLRAEMKGDSAYMIGIDLYKPHLDFTRKHKIYDEVILAHAAHPPFRDESFHVSLASELIEHMVEDECDMVFKELDRITSEKIVITTPNGAWELNLTTNHDNTYERHVSAHTAPELKMRGYKVKGIGFRPIKFYQACHSILKMLWGLFFYTFTPVAYRFPYVAEFLIAVKDQKKSPLK